MRSLTIKLLLLYFIAFCFLSVAIRLLACQTSLDVARWTMFAISCLIGIYLARELYEHGGSKEFLAALAVASCVIASTTVGLGVLYIYQQPDMYVVESMPAEFGYQMMALCGPTFLAAVASGLRAVVYKE